MTVTAGTTQPGEPVCLGVPSSLEADGVLSPESKSKSLSGHS